MARWGGDTKRKGVDLLALSPFPTPPVSPFHDICFPFNCYVLKRGSKRKKGDKNHKYLVIQKSTKLNEKRTCLLM